MLRRAVQFALLALLGLAVVVVADEPAGACHFGGVGCGEPEQAPFDPQPLLEIPDNRVGAHSDVVSGWTQEAHEQFVVDIVGDAPPEFGIDLDEPNNNEMIGDLDIRAQITQAGQTQIVDIDGDILDGNDGVNWPSGGVYRWRVVIHATTGDVEVEAFADKNAADGHLHVHSTVSEQLRQQAQAVDASVLELKQRIFGTVHGQPFLTNPSLPGTYTFTADLTAWDDPGNNLAPGSKHLSINGTIVERVPDSVSVAPANETKRVGQSVMKTATVLDQGDESLPGALVDFSVTGANPGLKCDDVPTDAQGQAGCSYPGTEGGNDTVTATATKHGVSAEGAASVAWREPTTVDLQPASALERTGASQTLTATVRDQNGQAMGGETVSFTRTGVNPGSGSGTTNAQGQATHTYTGTNAGDDTVTASVEVVPGQSISDASTISWYVAVPTALSLSPDGVTRSVGQTHTVTAHVLDQQGRVLDNATVNFTVTGANSASGSDATDVNGDARFSYAGQNAGNDTVTASAGAASDSVTVTWINRVPTTLDLSITDDSPFFTWMHPAHHTATIRAVVRDQDGQAMQDVDVRFEIIAGPNAGLFDEIRPTLADGSATKPHSGRIANGEGNDRIRVSVPGTGLVRVTDTPKAWRWHACDNPNGTYLGGPNGAEVSGDFDIQGERVVFCSTNPHAHPGG